MGWELRLFVPIESALDYLGKEANVRSRLDVYLVVSNRVGIKKRSNKQWEIKVQKEESKEIKGLQYWTKEPLEDLDSVPVVLRQKEMFGDNEKEALANHNFIHVQKQVRKDWRFGCCVEQTDLTCQNGEQWRTFS